MKLLHGWIYTVLMLMIASASGGSAFAADVLLGPGDGLKVAVYGHPDLSLDTRVSERGSIRFPLLGEVMLAGLDCAAAETRIAAMLDAGGFVRKPSVNVTLSQLNSKQISVLGQVNRPGRYPLDGTRTLTDIIALAGGIAAEGGDTAILVHRQTGQASKEVIDLAAIIRAGNMTQNIELMHDDVLYVERAPRFYIYGEVQRPGAYRLEPQMTLAHVLSLAGGLSPRGTERGARIKRRDDSGQMRVIDVGPADFIKVDDVVQIKESLF